MADALSTIRARVASKCGGLSGIDSLLNENINEAVLQVLQEAKPQEMWATKSFTTTAAKAVYDFSADLSLTDVYAVLFVRNTTEDIPLIGTSMEIYNRSKQDTSTSNQGSPRRWVRFQNSLILFNGIPDSTSRTIKMTYLKRPVRLSADTDIFPLNDEWKRPVEELAAAMTMGDRNAIEKMTAKLQTYDTILQRRTSPEGEEDATPEGAAFVPVSNLAGFGSFRTT